MEPNIKANPLAVKAFSNTAKQYHQLRPSYPLAACLQVLDVGGLLDLEGEARTVLELGPGTGILTRLLINVKVDDIDMKILNKSRENDQNNETIVNFPKESRMPEQGLYDLESIVEKAKNVICVGNQGKPHLNINCKKWIAVDPSSGMLDEFKKQIIDTQSELYSDGCVQHKHSLEIKPVLGSAIDLSSIKTGSIDTIIGGQCAHWFADPETTLELSRVLKPGGVLILLWNLDDTRIDWVKGFKNISNEYDHSIPQYRTAEWAKGLFECKEAEDNFDLPLYHSRWKNNFIAKNIDAACENFFTKSYIESLDDKEKEVVRSKLTATKSKYKNQIEQYNNSDGTLLYPHVTDIWWTERK